MNTFLGEPLDSYYAKMFNYLEKKKYKINRKNVVPPPPTCDGGLMHMQYVREFECRG